MPRRTVPRPLPLTEARRLWMHAQRLDADAPFGAGPEATCAAVEHLGYVQIDTINVIERCHHHVLWSRIPAYRRADLDHALAVDKSVFEYWAHALAYIPTRDYRFFRPEMARIRRNPPKSLASVDPADLRRVAARVRRDGPLSIRHIDDDTLVDKDHLWASRKPSSRALDLAFFAGLVTVSARDGMIKYYDLPSRHFGWTRPPPPAGERAVLDYLLDRALRAQGAVSLDSICYMDAPRKPAMKALIEARVRRRRLVPVTIPDQPPHWITPDHAEAAPPPPDDRVHLLSPFDPLIIQRKRLAALFGYMHRFEAYVPKEKRVLGYFALPVLVGDRIAAAIDLKADRVNRRLEVRQWTWIDGPHDGDTARIEAALDRFERFQFGD